MRLVIVLFSLIGLGACAQLPAGFQKCKRDDADLNVCLKAAIQDAFVRLKDGISNLSVPSLDPLNIPSATIPRGPGPVNVEQKYKDINLHNLVNSKIDVVEATLGDKVQIRSQISNPEVVLKADYDFIGRILLLPIFGVGKCTIKLTDLKSDMNLIGEKFEKKGKTYLNIKEFTISLKPGKVHFDFENLFNGDARLAKEMITVLNDNWKDVFEDVRPGYEELMSSIGKLIATNIFGKVPYDDIFLM